MTDDTISIQLTNTTPYTMHRRLFYSQDGYIYGNGCVTTTITEFFSSDTNTFASGVTVLLNTKVTVFVNLAGQTLTMYQLANILNATPALNYAFGIYFATDGYESGTAPFYSFASVKSIYVADIYIDGVPSAPANITIDQNGTYPIQATMPGGIANYENSLRPFPLKVSGMELYGTFDDAAQTVMFTLQEFWGSYASFQDPLSGKFDPYQKIYITQKVHPKHPLLLDGNSAVYIRVTAMQNVTLYVKQATIFNPADMIDKGKLNVGYTLFLQKEFKHIITWPT